MNKWRNYYKDWGNPTPKMMVDLDKLVKKFIATVEKLHKEKKEKEKYPLFHWRELCSKQGKENQ